MAERGCDRASLAATMIVRDEQRSIARAITSVRPHVDEVVVVDTGSVDNTVALAVNHGARVEYFTWCDDFAAARNAALEAADADFALVLDADEWVASPGRLREWVDSQAAATAGIARVVSSTESDGADVNSTIEQIRVLPRVSRYVGAIHEAPVGHAQTAPVPGMLLGHDGYEAAQVARKRGRNLSILLHALNSDPASPYLYFQIGREHQILNDWPAADAAFGFARRNLSARTRWQPELVARSLYVLARMKRWDEALAVARAELGAGTDSAEALFSIGNLCLDVAVARPYEHERWVALARSCWETCIQLGEDRARYDTTEGVGSYLAARNLAALSTAAGDQEGARRWASVERDLRSAP